MRNIFLIPDDAVNRQRLGFFKRFLTAIQYFYASFERLLVFIIEDPIEGQRSLETLLRSLVRSTKKRTKEVYKHDSFRPGLNCGSKTGNNKTP